MGFCQHCGASGAGKFCGMCGRPQAGQTARADVDLDAIARQMQKEEDDKEVYQGSTWPMCCLSPLCCSDTRWNINDRSIDWESGCCHNSADTIEMRRVKDLSFRRGLFNLLFCCGRGTIIVYADAKANDNMVKITKFNARPTYLKLRKAWTKSKMGMMTDNP
eukprot:m.64046 g.64046  ORF g.64046 m.64046 type:complete len:162 (+) comp13535_c0_seq1:133-618(+)